ncbi:MAG TPA: glycosyltransferase [Longimicrobiales bacterium]
MNSAHRTIVVVPCYNEEKRLRPVVFTDFVASVETVDLLLVNDGSTDRTADVLEDLAAASPRISVHALARNAGKAEAVRQGMLHAFARGAAFTGYWDADLAAPLDAIPRLLDMLRARPALDMVMGSRVQLLGARIDRSPFRHYLGRVLATAAAAALGIPVYDTQCGAKLLRVNEHTRAVFSRPFQSRWLFDVELLARLLEAQSSAGFDPRTRVNEVPLAEWTEVPGSKVKLLDGFAAFLELSRIRRRYARARRRWQRTAQPVAAGALEVER